MNCQKAQRYILLAASGERQRHTDDRVERHLRQCRACRDFEVSCRALSGIIPPLATGTVSGVAMARIRAAAQDAIQKRIQREKRMMIPVLAAASATVILVVAGIFVVPPEPRRSRIEEIRSIVQLAHGLEEEEQAVLRPHNGTDPLYNLGQQLLRWEGLHMVPSEEETWLTEDDGLSPTVLQWRSIRAPFEKTCG
ncbi:MAG: hypothetical protein N2255_03995 [Kiritimatiellae bacterium]|nr:hypothetical protein [Kiritimatiellia bacterium]